MSTFDLEINGKIYQFAPIAILRGDFEQTWVNGFILGYDATLKLNPLWGDCGTIQLNTDKYNQSEYFRIMGVN